MDIRIRGSRDGIETARLIHERWGTPVILLTAYADEDTIARAKITQPFGYILKPFEERELRTAIEIALYRAAMERKLRESEERFRRLFFEGISGNFLAALDGSILEANEAFRRLFGIGTADPLLSLADLFVDTASWQSFRTGLSCARRMEPTELAMKSRDGHEILVFANIALVFDAKGESMGIQGELSDLTERKNLEERLAHAQRMDAVGRLAGGIAHDFNNILTAIIGYANLLSGEAGENREICEDIDGIKTAAGRASALTRQLLAFSRRQSISPVVLDTNVVVKDMEKMLRRILTENISFSLSLDPSTPSILADPTQVEQVLVNLVVNAKDAMPNGGNLRISTRLESIRSPRIVGLNTLAPGDYSVISVMDSGIGIPAEIIDNIFEPFFTTKPKDQGTGLGLSMVYGIAKQTGGGVEVTSSPGAGALFKVWIPGVPSSALSRIEERQEIPPIPQHLGTILFVDDDEALRSLADKILSLRGHRVLVAANAGEALLIAESQGRPIDLLITDIVMPFMDGYRLAKRIGSIVPKLKVLFISGYPERAADVESAGRFLAKPFSEHDLALAVSQALS